MTRPDGRNPSQLRDISLTSGVNPYAEGSCHIKWGKTEVLCTASVVNSVPRWLKGQGKGWLTAEYGMLPRATGERKDREAVRGKQEGRTVEIQRLIGRSLRAVCDLEPLDGFTIHLDCDVLVADGGTRVASITGAYIALHMACKQLLDVKKIKRLPISHPVAAVSCGLSATGIILDMDYAEDSTTLADGNFVMAGDGSWLEIQISAEKRPLTGAEMAQMPQVAETGLHEIFELQRQILAQL